jgi:hypothetical protein
MAETPRKKTLEELRSEAIAELERRGYDVRGKTPAQIRKMLRPQATTRKLDPQKSLADQVSISRNNSRNAASDKGAIGG